MYLFLFLYFCSIVSNEFEMKKGLLKISVILLIAVIGYFTYSYIKENITVYDHKVVICIPVYGQSYALGEEAIRITDFDSLRIKYDGRIVTEHMDYVFGYFDHSSRIKQYIKRLLHYDKKAYELSLYGMAEILIPQLGKDTIVCIFPGGHGMNTIAALMKPVEPYEKFIKEIAYAHKKAVDRGWDFYVPAVCWMQGESDIVDYPNKDYKTQFHKMYNNLNNDIKSITHQHENIKMICYQTSVITKGEHYKPNNYQALEPRIPTAQMELIQEDSFIWASGPTYPYHFVKESLHIDAIGQKNIGALAAISAMRIIRHETPVIGLMPIDFIVSASQIRIPFHVPYPPLCFDTISVRKADNYGFNVIRKDNTDIISSISINKDTVIINCKESPLDCKLRYAINGDYMKGGCLFGPRGNLRDSQGDNKTIAISGKKYPLHNWCYQFDHLCTPNK